MLSKKQVHNKGDIAMNNKRKVTVGEPVVVAQSTTEPILHGGYQIPWIQCDTNGDLYVRFNGRKDCPDTIGSEDKNPVYCSHDMGVTWERSDYMGWLKSKPELPNGDRIVIREHPIIRDIADRMPPLPENRIATSQVKSCSIGTGITYTVEELEPIFGDKVAKVFNVLRLKKGETEAVEEESKIHWDNMPVQYMPIGNYLTRVFPWDQYRLDKNGVLWQTVTGGSVLPDGSVNSKRKCVHLLKSEDNGYNWYYVSTIVYKDEYDGTESLYGLEGFTEAALQILDDGTFIVIMRAGSLHPPFKSEDEFPKVYRPCYFAKSTDYGKTWTMVRPFYDYGIRPQITRLDNGTLVFIAGRPDVYIRTCDDPKGEDWNDVITIVNVPEEDRFERYYEYTCCNCDICSIGNTAFIAYSDFQRNAPDGKRAKSIMVSKITIE